MEVLRELFELVPKPNDSMIIQVMGNYPEDSIHTSYIFSTFPNYHTAWQALRAKPTPRYRCATLVSFSFITVMMESWVYFQWLASNGVSSRIKIFERTISLISLFTRFINPFITAAATSFMVTLIRGVSTWRLVLRLAWVLTIRHVHSLIWHGWLVKV